MTDDWGINAATRHVYLLAALFGLCDLLLTGLAVVSIYYLAPRDVRSFWACAAVTSGVAVFLVAWHALLGWN